ncbi:hypothetical protein [Pseudomonas nitroreducens]|uniref:hypothetical protein n=1 Tax=Pseudomonas nitroreducens TaxID=46680 RepID=UPI001877423B|nr:hypothetical protein [Pseudomonas nitritireducens]
MALCETLSRYEGLMRFDGITQVGSQNEKMQLSYVFTELNHDAVNYYAPAATQKKPHIISLSPKWISLFTVGSIWDKGRLVHTPAPLEESFQISPADAALHPYKKDIKIDGQWTHQGIVNLDFMSPKTHLNLSTAIYAIIPIHGNRKFKWMVIPCSEIFRFYYAPTTKLAGAVLSGQLDGLISGYSFDGSKVTIYENSRLTKFEAKLIARACASSNYRIEMQRVRQRLVEIKTTNTNLHQNAGLCLEARFPFSEKTNLRVAAVPMALVDGGAMNSLFVMKIHKCSFPLEYDKLEIHKPQRLAPGGANPVAGDTPNFYPTGADEIDDGIHDSPADARLERVQEEEFEDPFSDSKEIDVEVVWSDTESEYRTVKPGIGIPVHKLGIEAGSHEKSAEGTLGVDSTIKEPPKSSITDKLSQFFKELPDIEKAGSHERWQLSSRTLDENYPAADERFSATAFPPMNDGRRTWHLVESKDTLGKVILLPRQLACIEISTPLNHGFYFYILEMESKGSESHCTLFLRHRSGKQLVKNDLAKFLRLTAFNNGWPDLTAKKWAHAPSSEIFWELKQEQLLLEKCKHPEGLTGWHQKLYRELKAWLAP